MSKLLKACIPIALLLSYRESSQGLSQIPPITSRTVHPGRYGLTDEEFTSRVNLSALTWYSPSSVTGAVYTSYVPKNYPNLTKTCGPFDHICGNYPFDFSDQCMLWNTSCSGNRTDAILKFFGTTEFQLMGTGCFGGQTESNCGKNLPEVQALLSWMRTPQCFATMQAWMGTPQGKSAVSNWDVHRGPGMFGPGNNCCGRCDLRAQNVDIYYWPEPDADTSCLDLVGNSVLPLDYGATTDYAGTMYWGCHQQVSGGSRPVTYLTTTAMLKTFLTPPVTIKTYFENPWSITDCVGHTDTPMGSLQSSIESQSYVDAQNHGGSIQGRGHSLVLPSSVTRQDGVKVSTVVSENFTFTSPSIYAKFWYLSASESNCPGTLITSTMLSFTSGELSTLEYQNYTWITKSFDFRDLPCPARSVMERKFYSPEPGQPYRPFLAAPKQKLIEEVLPWFTNCHDGYFTGYDPPKTLIPAAAMVPDATSVDPLTTPALPTPSPSYDAGARKTTAAGDPSAPPADTAASSRAKETFAAGPQQEVSVPGVQPSRIMSQQDGHIESDPTTHTIDPQQSDISGHPGQGGQASAPKEPIPISVAASSGENTQPGMGTGKDRDPQQTISAGQYGGDPKEATVSSKTINDPQPHYAGNANIDATEPANPSKISTSAQPSEAGRIGGDPAKEVAPSKISDSAQPKNQVEADGGYGTPSDKSKTGEQAQKSYIYQNNEGIGQEAKTSKPSVPGHTDEALSGYNPLHLSPYQMSVTQPALPDTAQMPSPAQNQDTSPGVTNLADTSNTRGGSGNIEQGPKADQGSTPEHTTERYDPSHMLPDQMSNIDNALTMPLQKPQSTQNQQPGFQQINSPSPATPDTEDNSRSVNKPGSAATSLGASDESKVTGQDFPGPSAASTAAERLTVVANPLGVYLPSKNLIHSQFTTADGEFAAPLSNGVSILAVTPTLGAQATTLAGTQNLLASPMLVIGTKSIPFAVDIPESATTTIAGQAIKANPTAVEIAGSTLIPGGSNAIISGITVSLDSNNEMIVGTKTVALASSSAGLGEIIMGGLGAEGLGPTKTDSSSLPTRPSVIDSGTTLATTGSIPMNSDPSAIQTAPSSSNAGSSSLDTQSSSTDVTQASPTLSGGHSSAPKGEAASPRIGLFGKLTMGMVTIISILNQGAIIERVWSGAYIFP